MTPGLEVRTWSSLPHDTIIISVSTRRSSKKTNFLPPGRPPPRRQRGVGTVRSCDHLAPGARVAGGGDHAVAGAGPRTALLLHRRGERVGQDVALGDPQHFVQRGDPPDRLDDTVFKQSAHPLFPGHFTNILR